jgi:hypothetical protein
MLHASHSPRPTHYDLDPNALSRQAQKVGHPHIQQGSRLMPVTPLNGSTATSEMNYQTQGLHTVGSELNGKESDLSGLSAGELRVGHHHLQSSGRNAREEGHHGPRHANRRGAPLNDAPHGQVLRCGPRASRIRTQIENLINYSRASLTVKRQKLFQIEATAVAQSFGN